MTAARAIRDQLRDHVPWWLSDRHYSSGKTVGFRYLWTIVAPLDAFMQFGLEALRAAWPDRAPPTALGYIGRTRGILRGEADTDDEYRSKLRKWLEKWSDAGSQRQLAIEIHEYLGNRPRVRVVSRAGRMVTVEEDGTVTIEDTSWDWDSISHPERADYWSELWIIVYPTQWAHEGTWGSGGTWGSDVALGIGQECPRGPVDAIKSIVAQWKGGHTRVRAIVWTSDDTLFDPLTPASMPDGTWGGWGTTGSGSRVASNRNTTSCRYWEL